MDSSAIRNDRYETATASTDRGDKKTQRIARAGKGGLDGNGIAVPSPSGNVDATYARAARLRWRRPLCINVRLIFSSIRVFSDTCQQIPQPVSRQNNPPISNPP